MQKFEEAIDHPLRVQTPPPQASPNIKDLSTSNLSFDQFVNDLKNPKPLLGNRIVIYPYHESGQINGSEVRRDNHRHDERLTVELLNEPLSMPVPRVDMVILYYKGCNAAELSRIKSFHSALICPGGLKINFYRDNEGNYLFAKLYIPYAALYEQSDFKFADESQYTTLQRVYAIMKIINKTVVFSKFITDECYERYDYRRLINDSIIAGSYVPHEEKAQTELLHNWGMIKNLFNPQPIEKIREYCGAQVAIHFAWSAYFNVSLLLGALFGVVSFGGSLIVTHWQYDYSIEEVCAGVYDYYPRCPLCKECEYSLLSSTCWARRKLRRSSNILFCVLTSFLVSSLLTSFKKYLSKLTSSWEEPNTRQDVAVHHLTMTSQPRGAIKDSAAIELIRIDYLRKHPELMKVYDLAVKPPLDFEEMSNVCLQHIQPLEFNNTADIISGRERQNQGTLIDPNVPEDEIVSNSSHNRIAERPPGEWFELITLTPKQFQDLTKWVNCDDELGFVMSPIPGNRNAFSPSSGGGSGAHQGTGAVVNDNNDLDETISQQVAKEQDEAVYQIHGLQALQHCLIAWSMTFLFFLYFVGIVTLYIYSLNIVKIEYTYVQAGINTVLSTILRLINGKIVYYLTLYQVPKYESQFNKWLGQKQIILFYTEYALFFYTAIFAQLYFTNPGKLKDPPLNSKPCVEDDCHFSLANHVGKLLTVDQLTFLFLSHFYPVIANKMWGCSFCETSLFQKYKSFTLQYNSFLNSKSYETSKFFWGLVPGETLQEKLPPKKTYAVGSNQGQWFEDVKLVAYNTQPYMYSQNLVILKMFGYVALFGANWFMAPFVLYIVMLVYIRIHATDVLTNYRRPVPERTKSLGVWNKYIDNMVLISFLFTGFTFAFLSGVVPQTIHLMREGTLQYYMNTTLSFYGTKNSSNIFVKAHTDRDYCIYNGNMEPPWAEEPFTLSSIGCFRLFYKLLFFVLYGGVFQAICRWLRFDLVDLFDIFYDMTVTISSSLFQKLNYFLTPAPYTYNESTDGSNPFITKAKKVTPKENKSFFKTGENETFDMEEFPSHQQQPPLEGVSSSTSPVSPTSLVSPTADPSIKDSYETTQESRDDEDKDSA